MSELDHAAEAIDNLRAVHEIGFSNDSGYEKQELLAEAQVHATLALVEQQRIANLIAAFAVRGESAVDPARALVEIGQDGSFVRWRPDVARVLGLDAPGGAA